MSTLNSFVLILVLLVSLAVAVSTSNTVVVDNTSPQVIYSPTPCYEDTPNVCSIEWVLVQTFEAFNGSVTSTNGPLADPSNISVSILPRVTLNFNGSGIGFFTGPNSTANASITLDDRPSIIIDTSRQHYQVTQLGNNPHVLIIEYEPDLSGGGSAMQTNSGVLEVDFFVIDQAEGLNTSTSATSTLVPTSAFSSLTTTTTRLPSAGQTTTTTTSGSIVIEGSRDRPSVGTVIAIAISAGALFFMALLTWLLSAKYRRRRRAIKREQAILSGLKMPSEGDEVGGTWPGEVPIFKGKGKQPSRSWWV